MLRVNEPRGDVSLARRRLDVPCVSILIGSVLAASTVASGSPVEITALDAEVSSISLPLPGEPSTGIISIDQCTSCTSPRGSVNCASGSGILYWRTTINFPLLEQLERAPLTAILVGSTIPDPSFEGNMIAYDMGFIDDPDLGPMLVSNFNNAKGPIPVPIPCFAGGTLARDFMNVTQEVFDSVVQPWLPEAMGQALVNLRNLDPSVPAFSASVLETMFSMYVDDPSTEIVVYFPDSGEYRSGNLTGTFTIQFFGETLPTIPEWGVISLVVVLLGGGAMVFGRQRTGARMPAE